MDFCTQPKPRVARKNYRCDWCAEGIAKGESHMAYVSFFDGGAATFRLHPECNEALNEAMAEDARLYGAGGVFEYTPGEYDRPKKDTAHD